MTQLTHVVCPYCEKPEGYVRGLTINTNDQRTLIYTCEACHQSWRSGPHPGELTADMRLKQSQPDDAS